MILTVPASMVIFPAGLDPSINLQIDVGGYMGFADYGVSGLGDILDEVDPSTFSDLTGSGGSYLQDSTPLFSGGPYLQDSTPLYSSSTQIPSSGFTATQIASLIAAGGNAAASAIRASNGLYYPAGTALNPQTGLPYTVTASASVSSMLPIFGVLAVGLVVLFALKK